PRRDLPRLPGLPLGPRRSRSGAPHPGVHHRDGVGGRAAAGRGAAYGRRRPRPLRGAPVPRADAAGDPGPRPGRPWVRRVPAARGPARGGTHPGVRRLHVGEGVAVDRESGADVAYAEFVGASYGALVRTGYLLTGDRALAEDLVQACLLTTYRAWARL